MEFAPSVLKILHSIVYLTDFSTAACFTSTNLISTCLPKACAMSSSMENDGSVLALSILAMVERDLFTFLANAVWFNPVCCLNSNNRSAKSNFACSSSNACLNSELSDFRRLIASLFLLNCHPSSCF